MKRLASQTSRCIVLEFPAPRNLHAETCKSIDSGVLRLCLEVRAVPFYVGIGRSSRASDRVRYVRYLMGRSASGHAVKWVASNRVVAELLDRREQVTVAYLYEKLTRDQALLLESQEIRRLLNAGHVLANEQQNDRPASVEEVVSFVLSRGSMKGAEQDDSAPEAQGMSVSSPRKLAQSSKEHLREAEILSMSLYDAVVVATNKTTRPGDFFHLVQENAAKPIVLRDLIRLLIQIYRPPLEERPRHGDPGTN